MQSASDAKANLKALFNRLSGADAVKIDEDGFNLNDATPDDCVNIIERIKIELAAHCDTYTGDMSGIDVSKIEKVVEVPVWHNRSLLICRIQDFRLRMTI